MRGLRLPPLLPALALLGLLAGCRGAWLPLLPRSAVAGPTPGFRVVGPPVYASNPYQVYVHYAVPVERLRTYVPPRFVPVTRRLTADAPPSAFLTVTWFPQRGLRLSRRGPAHPGYDELNVRVPVVDRETGRALYWLLPALAPWPFGTALSASTGLDADDVPLRLGRAPETETGGERFWINRGRMAPGAPAACVEALPGPVPAPPGFAAAADARAVLLDAPLAAHGLPGAHRVGWMHIRQTLRAPRPARVHRLHLPHLDRSGLLPAAEQGTPHSAVVVACVDVRLVLLEPCSGRSVQANRGNAPARGGRGQQ